MGLKKLLLEGFTFLLVFSIVLVTGVLVLQAYDTELKDYCDRNNLTCFENCTNASIICSGDICFTCSYNNSQFIDEQRNKSTYGGWG